MIDKKNILAVVPARWTSKVIPLKNLHLGNRVPMVASGRAGNYWNMIEALVQVGVSAVAAINMSRFSDQTLAGAKLTLAVAGVQIPDTFGD